MHNRHHKILQAVFQNPALANINWRDIESLFHGLGAVVEEAAGSV